VLLESLPLMPNGKLHFAALPHPDSVRSRAYTPYTPPRSAIERTIAAAWQEVLGTEKLSIEDNFFDLGGHSMLMVQMHSKLRAKLPRDLLLVELFQFPTIRALAAHVDQVATSEAESHTEGEDRLADGKQRLRQQRERAQRDRRKDRMS
jgi:acyl carrier protein